MELRKPPRRWRLGPFTILAAVVAVFAYQAKSTSAPAVVQPPKSPVPPPLWKPEPSLIMDHAAIIGVEPPRLKRIRQVDARWRNANVAIEADMRRTTEGATRLDGETRAGLHEYSALSRQYDVERGRHWAEALAMLTPDQRKRAEDLRPKGEKR